MQAARRSLVLAKLSALAGLCLLAACESSGLADEEFSCAGQEQSSFALGQAGAPASISKSYPLTIDFHLRGDRVLVRSQSVPAASHSGSVRHFESSSERAWIKGQFDAGTRELRLLEQRRLAVDGIDQNVLTSGRYHCVPSTSAQPRQRRDS